MAQSGECCHTAPGAEFDPSTPIKHAGPVACPVIPGLERQRQKGPWGLLASVSQELTSFGLRDPDSKMK